MIDRGTNIKAGLDPLANSISGDIGNKWDFQGIGPENTKSQIVANTLLEKEIPGVKATRKYERTSFDKDESYLDMMRVDAEIDLNSETFLLWKESGLLSEEDLWIEEGATTGTFSWSRDMDTWGEGGSLITRINPSEQTDEILVSSGFTKENGDITGKGFNTNIIYSNRSVDGGTVKRLESHFDPDILRGNIGYSGQLAAAAKSVLAMPLDQQMKYVSGNLDWGTIEQSDWASYEPIEKMAFLEEQLFEKDLNKIVSAKEGTMDTRLATSEDVLEYKKEGISLERGDTVYFSPGKESFTKTKSIEPTKPTKGNQGKDFYDKVRKDPVGYFQEKTGIVPKYETNDKGDKIITIPLPEKKETNEKGEVIVTNPKEVYNMSNNAQRKDFYNQLLSLSEMGIGQSPDSKEVRIQFEDALSKGTARKKAAATKGLKKASDDYFSNEADKAIAKQKKKGKYD